MTHNYSPFLCEPITSSLVSLESHLINPVRAVKSVIGVGGESPHHALSKYRKLVKPYFVCGSCQNVRKTKDTGVMSCDFCAENAVAEEYPFFQGLQARAINYNFYGTLWQETVLNIQKLFEIDSSIEKSYTPDRYIRLLDLGVLEPPRSYRVFGNASNMGAQESIDKAKAVFFWSDVCTSLREQIELAMFERSILLRLTEDCLDENRKKILSELGCSPRFLVEGSEPPFPLKINRTFLGWPGPRLLSESFWKGKLEKLREIYKLPDESSMYSVVENTRRGSGTITYKAARIINTNEKKTESKNTKTKSKSKK